MLRSVISVCEICDFLSEVSELCVKFFYNELSFPDHFRIKMTPPKRGPRALKKKGEPIISGKVSVDLPRVVVESSDEESRSPPRQEADPNSGTGTGSTPGEGTRPGDGQEAGPLDQSTTEGTDNAGQSSSAE